mmetsp:Transcript_43962/g.116227  ORF Transcript_43962/g.116227 Transcript_43962/m.116227 type:complete len:191 (-) Transcript_43962:95-667(-)
MVWVNFSISRLRDSCVDLKTKSVQTCQGARARNCAGSLKRTHTFIAGVESDAKEVLNQSGNSRCFDCDEDCSVHPWTSLTFGTVLCLECAGRHRSLGTHVSVVRSLTLDTITDDDVQMLLSRGNSRFDAFLREANGPSRTQWRTLSFHARYQSPAARLYKQHLAMEGRESRNFGCSACDAADTAVNAVND